MTENHQNPFTVDISRFSYSIGEQSNPFTINYKLKSEQFSIRGESPIDRTVLIQSGPAKDAEIFTDTKKNISYADLRSEQKSLLQPIQISEHHHTNTRSRDQISRVIVEPPPDHQLRNIYVDHNSDYHEPEVQKSQQSRNREPSKIFSKQPSLQISEQKFPQIAPQELSINRDYNEHLASQDNHSFSKVNIPNNHSAQQISRQNNHQNQQNHQNHVIIHTDEDIPLEMSRPQQIVSNSQQHTVSVFPQPYTEPIPSFLNGVKDNIDSKRQKKPIFDISIRHQYQMMFDKHKAMEIMHDTSIAHQKGLKEMQDQLFLNYDITKFKEIQKPSFSDQGIHSHITDQYVFCTVCSEFINQQKLKNHSSLCQMKIHHTSGSKNFYSRASPQEQINRINQQLQKMVYLLHQRVMQMRDYQADSKSIRNYCCYGIVIMEDSIKETNKLKLEKKKNDLITVMQLLDQHNYDQVKFILQKAQESLQQKLELILFYNDK